MVDGRTVQCNEDNSHGSPAGAPGRAGKPDPALPPDRAGACVGRALILASGSPRRKELLTSAGFEFEVMVPPVEECVRRDPVETVRANACLKAGWASARQRAACVMGADTVVALGARVLGKPADRDEARRMLGNLAGRTHAVWTAVCFQCGEIGFIHVISACSRVTMLPWDPVRVDRYLEEANPLDKAGAYGIQDHGHLVVEHCDGDYDNVVGLPLGRVREVLGFLCEQPGKEPPCANRIGRYT